MANIPSIASARPYAFPHIDFKETIIGPLPMQTQWRDTIGVAGEFNRGPRGAVRISNRQDFVALYGESDDAGSVFVRQAMIQGATNYVISRVLPGPEPAQGAIALQSSISPGTIQAIVGLEGDRTTGLKFEASFIGRAMILPGEYIGSEVRVPEEFKLAIPEYEGTGYFDFVVADQIDASSSLYDTASADFEITNLVDIDAGGIQRVNVVGTSILSHIKPGRRLQRTALAGNGTLAFSSGAATTYLEVLSPPFLYDTGVWSFFVKGSVANTPVGGTAEVNLAAVASDYYTIGYNYRSGDGALLPHDADLGLFDPVRPDGEKADWYLTVGVGQSAPQPIYVLTFNAGEYGMLDTGIQVAFGAAGATTVQLIPTTRFTIPFIAGSVEVGNMEGSDGAAFLPGESAEVVLSRLRDAIMRSGSMNTLIADATVNDILLPVALAFTSQFRSADANRIYYTVTRNCVRNIPATTTIDVSNATDTHEVTIVTKDDTFGPYELDADGEFALAEDFEVNTGDQFVVTPALSGSQTITINTVPVTTITGGVHTAGETTFTVGTYATDLLYGDAQNSHYGEVELMVDGQSPLDTSNLMLYDGIGNPLVDIEALSPGVYGNKIRVTVRPMPPGQFRIEIVDESVEAFGGVVRPETFVLSNYTVDRQTGLYPETLDSKIVRIYFVPVLRAFGSPLPSAVYDLTPQRKAPPVVGGTQDLDPSARGSLYLRNMYLSGGTDRPRSSIGERFTEREYRNALQELEYEDVAILSLPGVVATDIRYEGAILNMLSQAERSNPTNGLRVAVLSGPRRVSPSRAQAIVSGLASNRLVMVTGHCTYMGMASKGVNAVPADGIYAGTLAANPPYVSPAALWAGRSAYGVTSVDTLNDPPSLDILTRSRVEALHYDQGLRVFKFLNGITTSVDPFERWISVRRMMDQIVMDLYRNLLFIRSMPHTPSLRRRVAGSIDAYLKNLMREEQIYRYQPTICNESNNTMFDVSRGRLNVRVIVTPLFPADFIMIDLIRDLTNEMSLITQPG